MRKNKLRLMQITHDLAIGGLQQVVVNICRTIDREKFDISVMCLRNLGEFAPEVEQMGIKVFFIPQKPEGADYLSFFKVAKILRQEKIDVIHTHNTQPFVDGTMGALMSGVKIIVHTDHARQFPDKKRYMFAEWLMSHFAYKIVGVSEHTTQNLIRYEKIAPRKLTTILNGIDGAKYDIDIDKFKKRKELGIINKGPVIGLGARLVEQKGIDYLIKAMPAIIKEFPDITLVIAGKGNYDDALRDEAKTLGVDRNTLFAGPRLDMPELLKLFDVYVLPSLWEGLPMILLEAMAAGCPVVATNVGGIPKVIEHGKNGSLVEPRDPAAISAEVINILKDSELRQRYIKNGLQSFREKYSAEIMTGEYQKLYLREQ